MNETLHNGDKAGRYYRLFVIAQAVMLFAFIGLRDLASRDRHGARVPKGFSDINGSLKMALKVFKDDCGRFPTTVEGWKVLMSAPTDGSLTNWRGPYVDPANGTLEDPWGHEYVYRFPAIHSTNSYDLYSLGPDGQSKSGGNDPDDINNWGKSWAPRPVNMAILIDRNEDWLLLIPLSFLGGMLAQLTFPNVRQTARENGWVDWLWFATALLALMVLITPKISG